MTIETMIAYAQEVAETIDDPLDKTHVYQIGLWLQELKDFRERYEPEKNWLRIDASTADMIQESISKRGRL